MRVKLAVLTLLVAVCSHDAHAAVLSCDEPGVLAALAAGGGPHTFSCADPTTIVTSAELVIAQSVELDGSGLLTLSGGHAHRVIYIDAGQGNGIAVTLRNLAAIDGVAPESLPGSPGGGCIATREDLTLVNVEVSGCDGAATPGGAGGGISSQSAALTVVDSRIQRNRAATGGGISANNSQLTLTRTSIRDNRASNFAGGGGLLLSNSNVLITDSTISGNIALRGGAIYAYSTVEVQTPLSIARSTLAHNTDNSGALVVDGADVEIEDSTFAGNLPAAVRVVQGQHAYTDTNNLRIRSSTLVGNAGTVPSTIWVDPELPPSPGRDGHFYATVESSILIPGGSGSVISEGGNIFVTQGTCDPIDQCVSKDDLNLGKLGPHGGPTWTVPLKSPSVAIDAAPGCLTATDQRGVSRPQGAACDVGAFEWDGPAPGAVPALPPAGIAVLALACAALGARALRR